MMIESLKRFNHFFIDLHTKIIAYEFNDKKIYISYSYSSSFRSNIKDLD